MPQRTTHEHARQKPVRKCSMIADLEAIFEDFNNRILPIENALNDIKCYEESELYREEYSQQLIKPSDSDDSEGPSGTNELCELVRSILPGMLEQMPTVDSEWSAFKHPQMGQICQELCDLAESAAEKILKAEKRSCSKVYQAQIRVGCLLLVDSLANDFYKRGSKENWIIFALSLAVSDRRNMIDASLNEKIEYETLRFMRVSIDEKELSKKVHEKLLVAWNEKNKETLGFMATDLILAFDSIIKTFGRIQRSIPPESVAGDFVCQLDEKIKTWTAFLVYPDLKDSEYEMKALPGALQRLALPSSS